MTRRQTAIDRRSFLIALGATGLATACGSAGAAPEFDLGSRSSFGMVNWADYIDPTDGDVLGTVDRFQQASGIVVDYAETYESNAVGIELLANAGGRTDIIVPTNWLAAQVIERGDAEPIPIEIIPNHANIDPQFLTNSWDRGCRFQMPWQSGLTGIAYDPALTGRPLTSIADLFDPAFKGRIGFIVEMREAVGLGMLLNGDDPSRPTLLTAQAGLDRIRSATESGQVGAFTEGDFTEKLDSGELVAAMAWSGDTFLLQQGLLDIAARPDIEFVIPDEGAVQWFDTMLIPRGSSSLAAAGEFMNFVYDPVQAAQITAWVGYVSPVLGVQEELRAQGLPELADDPLLFPDNATKSRLFTWGGLSADDETKLETEFAALF